MNTKKLFNSLNTLFYSLFLFNILGVSAQVSNLSFEKKEILVSKKGMTNIADIQNDFYPSLELLDVPMPGGSYYNDHLQETKNKNNDKLKNQFLETNSLKIELSESPTIGLSFEGNQATSIPNDNALAISNSGWLVSVVNSTIYMKNVNNLEETPYEISLSAFSESLGTYLKTYDPRIVYDQEEDRFILLFLNGYNSQASNIIVAFSESNNPTQNWSLYEIPGDPFDDERWTDYPMMTVNKNELFISANLIKDGENWQSGYTKTVIWQINKYRAYSGKNNLNIMIWDQNYTENQNPIRNAIPVKGGLGLTGPNQYFLSNKNFATSNDSIFLIELTNPLGSENAEIKIDVLKSNALYGLPQNIKQKGSIRNLLTNDGRILAAIIQDHKIHFVSTSIADGSDKTGIYHGIIENLSSENKEINAQLITDPQLNLAYPNLSYAGLQSGDNEFIITFGHASPEHFAGHSMVLFDNGSYSKISIIKEGENAIGISQHTGNERWGDYTGSQLQYNKPGNVWTVGTYGKANNKRGTWIAQLISPKAATLHTDLDTNIENWETNQESFNKKIRSYPNPARDFVYLEFEMFSPEVLNFELYNNQGILINKILNQEAKTGVNQFKFSTNSLNSGLYFLKINNKSKTLVNRKIIIQ